MVHDYPAKTQDDKTSSVVYNFVFISIPHTVSAEISHHVSCISFSGRISSVNEISPDSKVRIIIICIVNPSLNFINSPYINYNDYNRESIILHYNTDIDCL